MPVAALRSVLVAALRAVLVAALRAVLVAALRALIVATLAALVAMSTASSAAVEPTTLVALAHRPPTDAAVIDPFRPPAQPYGAGNRGLEYGTVAGESVRASAEGTVRFAGSVGTHSSVTVAHDDGLVTTYSYLRETAVGAGDVVAAGTIVGVADAGFHFGVKRGDVYLDPAVLLAASDQSDSNRAILVPVIATPGP